MQRETYNISEYNKLLVNTVTSGSVKTTYKGICDSEDYVANGETLAIRSILKIVEDSTDANNTLTSYFRPALNGKMDSRKAYIWNNRASLTYM